MNLLKEQYMIIVAFLALAPFKTIIPTTTLENQPRKKLNAHHHHHQQLLLELGVTMNPNAHHQHPLVIELIKQVEWVYHL
jgi:hypothetical protein